MGLNITDKANCRANGFHCAENPLDCLSYYPDMKMCIRDRPLVILAFFVTQMPETALRINQSNRKAGNVNESESEKEVW